MEQKDYSILNIELVSSKYFQEKGIKFAAVIIIKQRYSGKKTNTSRDKYSLFKPSDQLLDQSVDERLSSIRKQCGLDTKSSFFTVAPGSSTEMQEFVNR
jgi:hypothetical protein